MEQQGLHYPVYVVGHIQTAARLSNAKLMKAVAICHLCPSCTPGLINWIAYKTTDPFLQPLSDWNKFKKLIFATNQIFQTA